MSVFPLLDNNFSPKDFLFCPRMFILGWFGGLANQLPHLSSQSIRPAGHNKRSKRLLWSVYIYIYHSSFNIIHQLSDRMPNLHLRASTPLERFNEDAQHQQISIENEWHITAHRSRNLLYHSEITRKLRCKYKSSHHHVKKQATQLPKDPHNILI